MTVRAHHLAPGQHVGPQRAQRDGDGLGRRVLGAHVVQEHALVALAVLAHAQRAVALRARAGIRAWGLRGSGWPMWSRTTPLWPIRRPGACTARCGPARQGRGEGFGFKRLWVAHMVQEGARAAHSPSWRMHSAL